MVVGKVTVLLFMDDKLSQLEIVEFNDFSDRIKFFRDWNLCCWSTDSHISMRTMMMGPL